MLCLSSTAFHDTYHDAMDLSSINSSSVEEVPPPPPIAPVTLIDSIPVATCIPNCHQAFDVNDFDLNIGDNMVISSAGHNNAAGDPACIVEIHTTKQN